MCNICFRCKGGSQRAFTPGGELYTHRTAFQSVYFSQQFDFQISQQRHCLRQGEFCVLQLAAEDVDFIPAGLFEVCLAHIALEKLGVQQVAFLKIRADEIALGEHRALDDTARKFELCQVHFGEGVPAFQIPLPLTEIKKHCTDGILSLCLP